MTTSDRIGVLDQQQQLLTDGLAKMLTGAWVGFPSLAADLDALSPGVTLDPHPPVLTSEAGPPAGPDWLTFFNQHRDWPMERQAQNWTCSICSLCWLLQATNLAPDVTRDDCAVLLGYPSCVNPAVGLANIQCMVDAIASFGVTPIQAWVSFDQAYAIAGATAGIINPIGMYHFMGLRGPTGSDLWVANSATPGYDGVYDTLSRGQFNSLGPVQVVYLQP